MGKKFSSGMINSKLMRKNYEYTREREIFKNFIFLYIQMYEFLPFCFKK